MESNGKGTRTWRVDAPPLYDENGGLVREDGEVVYGELNADEVAAMLVDVGTVVRMVGGVCTFGAQRVEVAPGQFETVAIVAQWSSYAPAQRVPKPEPAAEQPVELAEEAEPVAAAANGAGAEPDQG